MTESAKGIDWAEWHARYADDVFLQRRLEIVQREIGRVLDEHERSPLRVVSMCAGEARDILGAVAAHSRRDLTGRLVELDPNLARIASQRAEALGLDALEVTVGDAGDTTAYEGTVPADLVLACGVFGNVPDADVEATLRALPMLSAPDATVIWTRHRRAPDLTVDIRRWLEESGFENTVFEPIDDPERQGSVGVARFVGATSPFERRHLFTFTRESL